MLQKSLDSNHMLKEIYHTETQSSLIGDRAESSNERNRLYLLELRLMRSDMHLLPLHGYLAGRK